MELPEHVISFTEHDIEKLTSNYSTLIGKGGFGEVFRGIIDDEDDVVAVKKYIRGDLREDFMEEVRIHSQMSHKNIVKLIGCCIGETNLMMVTEFISNGNLEDKLHKSDIPIPLSERLGIAIGCAEALSYMHSMHLSGGSVIFHGDIKPENILLDANLTAKVSDFGISKSLSGGITRCTSIVKGSRPYMDPIYYREGHVTRKSDVYSFGAVLVELISRKSMKEGVISCEAFNQACAKGKGLKKLLDPTIKLDMNILEGIAQLAAECMSCEIDKRPSMNVVAQRLRVLKIKEREKRASSRLSLRIVSALKKGYKQRTSVFSSHTLKKKEIVLGSTPSDFRIFTKKDLIEITYNYSYLLGNGRFFEVYRGSLEDNTMVAVKKFSTIEDLMGDTISNTATITHKYIIKLLGCCFDVACPFLVFEYAAKGSLDDILYSDEDMPLELRLNIAVKTAEALEYLHTSAFCVIRHGDVRPYTILLDNNFIPKIGGIGQLFNRPTLDAKYTYNVRRRRDYSDPFYMETRRLTVKSDVYSFGIVLFELISRKKPVYICGNHNLTSRFIRAYEVDKSGKAMFDKDITAEEDISALEEIGRLALECVRENINERPTMKEVAERLKMIRRAWIRQIRELTETEATKAVGNKVAMKTKLKLHCSSFS